MSVEEATGPLPTAENSSVKVKVEFFEKEIGRMSQQEEHRRESESEGRTESEHKLKDSQHENGEHSATSSNGQGDAAVVVEIQGTQSGKGQGTGTTMNEGVQDLVAAARAQSLDNTATTAVPVKVAAVVDAESNISEGQPGTSTISKSSPTPSRRPQTASPSAVRPLSASQDFIGSQTATVPEPFRFSLDSRPRRSSDGGVQTPPDAAKRRPRSSSHTGSSPGDLKVVSSTGRKAQTTQKPFNLEGLKRHERALEQLKAEIAAKEAEETAPRSFKARPILKPDVAPSPRVVLPPTKPSAFKLSVEDRAERRDKFKKQVEDRERQLEGEREKMLQELKKEVDKEEKQVRRSASFKAAPAKLTPDAKVFKPTLGQSPRTTPRAPVLGPQRRHSTGSQDGSTAATPDKGAGATPGASPRTTQPSSRPASKPASPLTGKAPSPRVSRPPSAGLAKTPSPRPVKSASPSSAKTPSPRLSKPATPSPKPSPSPAKAVTPRLTKPAPLRSGSPGVGKTPSPVPKKASGQGGSTPASPRPASTAVAKVSTRRSSDTSGAAGRPSSPAAATASPSAARSPAAVGTKQGSRPLSASKAGVASPGTPSTPTSRGVASPKTASTASPRGVARPLSASAAKSTASPMAKVTPSKVAAPKVTSKAATDEKKPTEATIPSSTPAETAVTGSTDGKAATANGDEESKEPPAKPETSADPNKGLQGEESALERAQLEGKANTSGLKSEALVPAEVEPKDSLLAKVEANGIAVLDADERSDEALSVQPGHAL